MRRAVLRFSAPVGASIAVRPRANGVAGRSARDWPGAFEKSMRDDAAMPRHLRNFTSARAHPPTIGHLRPMIAERTLLFSGTQGAS